MNINSAFDLGILAFARGLECDPSTHTDFLESLPAVAPVELSHKIGIGCGFCHRLFLVPTVTKEESSAGSVGVTCTRCGNVESISIYRLYGGEAELRRAWRAGWLSAEALDAARKEAE